MTAIILLLGLISGTGLTIAGIIWYSTLFTSFQFSTEVVRDFNELTEKRSIFIHENRQWEWLARSLPNVDMLFLSTSTRGSEEILNAQIEITKSLIESKRVNIVAIDIDWHQIHAINLYIRNLEFHRHSSSKMISRTQLWPQWIIANNSFVRFIEWLKIYNLGRPWEETISIFGIDINNPKEALDLLAKEVQTSTEISPALIELQSCLNFKQINFDEYAKIVAQGGRTCEHEAISLLEAIEESKHFFENPYDHNAYNIAELARLIITLEQYYQHLHSDPKLSWNAKSTHYAKSILRLVKRRQNIHKMAIFWGHHSMLANSLQPEMQHLGFVNTRDEIKEYNTDHFSMYTIGFLAYRGEVLASPGPTLDPKIYTLLKPIDESLESQLWIDSKVPYFVPVYHGDLRRKSFRTPINYRILSDVVNTEDQKEFYSPIIVPSLFDGILLFPEVSALKTLTPAKKATD